MVLRCIVTLFALSFTGWTGYARAMQDADGAPVLFVPRAFRAGGLRAEESPEARRL